MRSSSLMPWGWAESSSFTISKVAPFLFWQTIWIGRKPNIGSLSSAACSSRMARRPYSAPPIRAAPQSEAAALHISPSPLRPVGTPQAAAAWHEGPRRRPCNASRSGAAAIEADLSRLTDTRVENGRKDLDRISPSCSTCNTGQWQINVRLPSCCLCLCLCRRERGEELRYSLSLRSRHLLPLENPRRTLAERSDILNYTDRPRKALQWAQEVEFSFAPLRYRCGCVCVWLCDIRPGTHLLKLYDSFIDVKHVCNCNHTLSIDADIIEAVHWKRKAEEKRK